MVPVVRGVDWLEQFAEFTRQAVEDDVLEILLKRRPVDVAQIPFVVMCVKKIGYHHVTLAIADSEQAFTTLIANIRDPLERITIMQYCCADDRMTLEILEVLLQNGYTISYACIWSFIVRQDTVLLDRALVHITKTHSMRREDAIDMVVKRYDTVLTYFFLSPLKPSFIRDVHADICTELVVRSNVRLLQLYCKYSRKHNEVRFDWTNLQQSIGQRQCVDPNAAIGVLSETHPYYSSSLKVKRGRNNLQVTFACARKGRCTIILKLGHRHSLRMIRFAMKSLASNVAMLIVAEALKQDDICNANAMLNTGMVDIFHPTLLPYKQPALQQLRKWYPTNPCRYWFGPAFIDRVTALYGALKKCRIVVPRDVRYIITTMIAEGETV